MKGTRSRKEAGARPQALLQERPLREECPKAADQEPLVEFLSAAPRAAKDLFLC
jgi:hypothetical protein